MTSGTERVSFRVIFNNYFYVIYMQNILYVSAELYNLFRDHLPTCLNWADRRRNNNNVRKCYIQSRIFYYMIIAFITHVYDLLIIYIHL